MDRFGFFNVVVVVQDMMLLSLEALNEIAFKPAFLAQRVEKERKAVLSELQMMNTIEYRYVRNAHSRQGEGEQQE